MLSRIGPVRESRQRRVGVHAASSPEIASESASNAAATSAAVVKRPKLNLTEEASGRATEQLFAILAD